MEKAPNLFDTGDRHHLNAHMATRTGFLVCPPERAFEFIKQLPHASLTFVPGGHSATDPAIERQLRVDLQVTTTLPGVQNS